MQARAEAVAPTCPDRRSFFDLFALILLGLNLRPLFSSLSAVLLDLGPDELAGSWKPLVSSLPVFLLGIGAAMGARIVNVAGTHASALMALTAVGAGTAMRGLGHPGWLVGGTCIGALGIALGNVALPSITREKFDRRIGLATAAYTAALAAGASAGALLTPVVLDMGATRPAALALWGVPAAMATLVWLLQPATGVPPVATRARPEPGWLPLACLMGASSTINYCVVGWLVPLLQLQGLPLGQAGTIASIAIVAQVMGSFVAPLLASKPQNRVPLGVALGLVAGSAMAGFQFLPQYTYWLLALVQGFFQGGLFALAMSLIIFEAADPQQITLLSGKVQSWGYTFAASGPHLLGWLLLNRPEIVPIFFASLGAFAAVAAIIACRPRQSVSSMKELPT